MLRASKIWECRLANMWNSPTDLLGQLPASPNGVVFTNSPSTFTVGNQTFGNPQPIRIDTLQDIRCRKLFTHFAGIFVEQFPNWELLPSREHPINEVVIRRKDGRYQIETHGNAIIVIGRDADAFNKVNQYGTFYNLVFYGWALGVDDAPDFISNTAV